MRKRKARLSGRCARVGRSSRSRSCLVPWRVLLRRGEWSGDNSCVIARVGYQRGCELVYRISTRSFTLHSSFTPSRSGKGAKTKKRGEDAKNKKRTRGYMHRFHSVLLVVWDLSLRIPFIYLSSHPLLGIFLSTCV